MTERVSEGSVSYIEATFRDKAGVLTSPSSARYRIDCRTTGTAILAWTAVTGVSSAFTIEVASTSNAIIVAANELEVKTITVEATYGVTDKITGEYDYFVKNLRNYP